MSDPSLSTLAPEIFHQIVLASRFGVLVTDPNQPDNPIVQANPAFCAMTGYQPAEVLGRNCRFLQTSPAAQPGENATALAALRTAIAGRRHAVVTLRNYHKDGSGFWNELALFPINDATGSVRYFVGQQLDVTARVELQAELERAHHNLAQRVATRTAELQQANEKFYNEILERRKVERALRTTERKYRGMFENAVEGIYQSTPDGHYLDVNPALARMYGFASPAAMLAAVGDIAHDVYVDAGMRARFRELIERDGVVQNLEYQVRRRDGVIIWIAENARVVRDRRGNVLHYEGTIQDITGRKQAEAENAQLEQQLLQSQKMEAIGTLAGGIAHDFNNIVGAIAGYLEMALDDLPADTLATNNVRAALAAARRAKGLVQQILAFSRRSQPRREPVRVGALVNEALVLLRATLPAAIRVETTLLTSCDHAVADPVQLHQVLLNLATNAAHAMRDAGGTLAIRLDRVVAPVGGAHETAAAAVASEPPVALPARLPPGSYLRVAVRDTGHGMAPEVRQRIFEPFFTTKPVGEGTGLGLSVVHGIMQSHGGYIDVTSAPGAGSTFTIWLPAVDTDAAAS